MPEGGEWEREREVERGVGEVERGEWEGGGRERGEGERGAGERGEREGCRREGRERGEREVRGRGAGERGEREGSRREEVSRKSEASLFKSKSGKVYMCTLPTTNLNTQTGNHLTNQ